jgi:hypothetical protein
MVNCLCNFFIYLHRLLHHYYTVFFGIWNAKENYEYHKISAILKMFFSDYIYCYNHVLNTKCI